LMKSRRSEYFTGLSLWLLFIGFMRSMIAEGGGLGSWYEL
jgi:hypothetical protein